MKNKKPINYEFKQIERGLTAFFGNVEKKINEIYPDIPVFMLESGDESYWLKEKFEKTQEIFLQVPRVNINVESIEFQTDQDTNQYTKILYKFNDNNYLSQVRRKATNIPIILNLVCSNFIKALEYTEVISSILCIDNTFSYHHLGNNYESNYNLTSLSMEKNTMDIGGTKNYVIKANIDLILQLFLVNYKTIEKQTFANKSTLGGYNENGSYVGGYDAEGNMILNGQYNEDGLLVGIYDQDGNQLISGNINGPDEELKTIFNIESENNIQTYFDNLDTKPNE